jgi:hypothetical protein
MKKFFKNHPEPILIFLALLFGGAIIGSFMWGVGDVVTTVNRSLNFTPDQATPGFDIQGAANLDLRGLTP